MDKPWKISGSLSQLKKIFPRERPTEKRYSIKEETNTEIVVKCIAQIWLHWKRAMFGHKASHSQWIVTWVRPLELKVFD